MAAVLLENLVKVYPESGGREVRAVDGISLSVESGEFMVLVGPSGCGKTSTLRMIAGLEEVTSGTVAIDGRVVNGVPPKDRDIAMVFQNYALYPHLSVYENMGFGLRMRRYPKAEIDRRVREAAALLGLEGELGRRPASLSGGQRQRVAVGRAIVRQPKVFLFDEPLSNLDAKMRVAMRRELCRIHARLGATMIYVTHDQAEAMTMGDRICVMKDGRIQQVDRPLQIYRRPKNLFVAGFVGSPPMNFFRGKMIVEAGQALLEGGGLRLDVAGRPSLVAGKGQVFGVRPEDVRIRPAGTEGPGFFSATVDAIEPMGADTYLTLSAGPASFVAKVASSLDFAVGQSVGAGFDPSKIHLFDGATEEHL